MKSFCPTSGTESEWAQARARVAAYLQALNLTIQEQNERITMTALRQAVSKHQENPGESPTALTMDEIQRLFEKWFERLPGLHGRAAPAGYVSLYAIEAGKKWPEAFLSEDVPDDFQRALQGHEVRAAPDLSVSSMVPRPFENALQDITLSVSFGELARGRGPLLARAFAIVLSLFSFLWWGNRMR